MFNHLSDKQSELASTILPAITEAVEWHDHWTEFDCPATGQLIQVFARNEVDIDEDKPEKYSVIASDSTYSLGSVYTNDRDESLQAIAGIVAGGMLNAKKSLLDLNCMLTEALSKLGLKLNPTPEKTEIADNLLATEVKTDEWDESYAEYTFPISGKIISISKRDEVDVDEDNPEKYIIQTDSDAARTKSLLINDHQEAQRAVAEMMAEDILHYIGKRDRDLTKLVALADKLGVS
jgi:hypothetical protein